MSYIVNAIGDHFTIQGDDGRYYAEQIRGGFSSDQGQATIFASQAKADDKVRQLRELELLDRPIKEFVVKATVRVSGNPVFSKADLMGFLKRAVAVTVDGDGPVPDSLLTVTLDWDSTKRGKRWMTE
jgi:hypothetical protein